MPGVDVSILLFTDTLDVILLPFASTAEYPGSEYDAPFISLITVLPLSLIVGGVVILFVVCTYFFVVVVTFCLVVTWWVVFCFVVTTGLVWTLTILLASTICPLLSDTL